MTERTDIIERLRDRCDRKFINALCEDAAVEIERLTTQRNDAQNLLCHMSAEIERLCAALKEIITLKAEDMPHAIENSMAAAIARAALEPKP